MYKSAIAAFTMTAAALLLAAAPAIADDDYAGPYQGDCKKGTMVKFHAPLLVWSGGNCHDMESDHVLFLKKHDHKKHDHKKKDHHHDHHHDHDFGYGLDLEW